MAQASYFDTARRLASFLAKKTRFVTTSTGRSCHKAHARGLSQLYHRGMPLGGSASAGDGNENAAKREGRTPPALPREPHMDDGG